MELDLSIFEASLKQLGAIVTGLDEDALRLRDEIGERQTELSQIAEQRIGWLRLSGETKNKLKIPLTPEELAALAERTESGEPQDSTGTIPRNAFSGMGPAEAALKYLRLLKRSQTHLVLVNALLKGKVMSEARNPKIAFRTAMSRHPEWFVWIKEDGKVGRWELTEWQNQQTSGEGDAKGDSEVPKLSLVAQAGSGN